MAQEKTRALPYNLSKVSCAVVVVVGWLVPEAFGLGFEPFYYQVEKKKITEAKRPLPRS